MKIIDRIVDVCAFLLVCMGIGSAGTVMFALLPIAGGLWLFYRSQRTQSIEREVNRARRA